MISPYWAALPMLLDSVGVDTGIYGDDWDMGDKALSSIALAGLIADRNQTRKIAKNPDKYHERNQLLGRHPSTGKVDGYFGLAGLGGLLAARNLPSDKRKMLLGLGALGQFNQIKENQGIGLGMGGF